MKTYEEAIQEISDFEDYTYSIFQDAIHYESEGNLELQEACLGIYANNIHLAHGMRRMAAFIFKKDYKQVLIDVDAIS